MKLSKIFFGVAAAAMFAACSSDELVQEQGQPQWNEDGTGYMAFSVAMPQAPASRAVTTSDNDQFEDGLDNEFEVKNMILVLFQTPDSYSGSDHEGNAVFASAYDVTDTDFGMVGTSTDNVTSDRLIVKQITKPAGSGNIYAFVVLNNNGLFEVTTGDKLSVNGSNFTGKIGDLQGLKITGINNNATNKFQNSTNGFLMMNAPLYTEPGGDSDPSSSGKVQVLAPVTSTSIKGTKAEAQHNVAAHVYVERAVAKVTMQPKSGSHAVTAPNRADFNWTLTSWQLDNTNKKSYLVRNTEGFSAWTGLHSAGITPSTKEYRFVGSASVAHNPGSIPDGAEHVGAALYRTYFAKDPNYTGTFTLTDEYNHDASAGALVAAFGDANPQYCAENTFDVANQVWDHTTRVVVKTTLTKGTGGTLYGRPGDDGFFSESAIKTLAYNKAVESFNTAFAGLTPAEQATITGTVTYDPAKVTVSSTADQVTVKITGLTCSELTGNAHDLVEQYQNTGVIKSSADFGDIHYYTDGVAYYQARIKHFGDDLTPWNTWEDGTTNTKPTTSVIYPNNTGTGNTQNDKYLGRWGMLRNNWYDLKVNNIKKLGEYDPTKLTLGTKTDDELEEWIAVDVNILSWAKRAQDIDF